MFAETALLVTAFILKRSLGIFEIGYIADVKDKVLESESKIIS